MAIKTIFLDRDGVINEEVNYLFQIEKFKFIDGIFEACLYFQKLGYKIIIVSNQSGIARKFYNVNDYMRLTKWMLGQFDQNNIVVLDTFYCPHNFDSQCNCRKPKPGMLISAKAKHNIKMEDSWMIGDKESDIQAANNAGITKTILVRSGHEVDELNSNAEYIINSIIEAQKFIKF